MRFRLLAGLTVIVLALAATAAGCGGDDSDDEQTVTATDTASQTDTAGSAALHECPDTDVGGVAVTEFATNLDCAEAGGIVEQVVSQDDCVEETPAGENSCRVAGYDCTTSIEGPPETSIFDIQCDAGTRHIQFQQQTTSAGDTETGTGGTETGASTGDHI